MKPFFRNSVSDFAVQKTNLRRSAPPPSEKEADAGAAWASAPFALSEGGARRAGVGLFKPFFIFFITLSLAVTGVSAARAADGIGLVITAEGTAHARRGGADVPLALKDRVFVSDTLVTGADSTLQILLDDDSSVTISANSSVSMVDFSNDENDARFSSHLAEGRMRVITGQTTERNPEGFKITTRHATIGIRGTILTLTAAHDFTTVDVNSTALGVIVNGVLVPEFYKIEIREGAEPDIIPLPPEERISDGELAGEPGGEMTETEDPGSSGGGGDESAPVDPGGGETLPETPIETMPMDPTQPQEPEMPSYVPVWPGNP